MNKDELIGYIQGLLDMSKEINESRVQKILLNLINKSLKQHKNYTSKDDINYFNKRADEYPSPKKEDDDDPIWNGPSEDLLPDDVDKGFIKHKQIIKTQKT